MALYSTVPRAKKDLPGCGSASQRGVLIPATTRRRCGRRSSRCLKLAKHRPFSPITDLRKRQISFEFLCESLRTVRNVNKDVTRRVNWCVTIPRPTAPGLTQTLKKSTKHGFECRISGSFGTLKIQARSQPLSKAMLTYWVKKSVYFKSHWSIFSVKNGSWMLFWSESLLFCLKTSFNIFPVFWKFTREGISEALSQKMLKFEKLKHLTQWEAELELSRD